MASESMDCEDETVNLLEVEMEMEPLTSEERMNIPEVGMEQLTHWWSAACKGLVVSVDFHNSVSDCEHK